MKDDDPLRDAMSLGDMARKAKAGDRWPYEPPAPDSGPEDGVREPRRPAPNADHDAAELDSELDADTQLDIVSNGTAEQSDG